MKVQSLALLLALIVSTVLFAQEYPVGPDSNLTPGMLCKNPDSYRYPEQIPYCERDVSPDHKNRIFADYRKLGYNLNPKMRRDYKIDHLIPLCAGGSNETVNLWPQHKSVYEKTDKMEALGCEKLAAGRIRQAELVELILEAKKNLALVRPTLDHLNSL